MISALLALLLPFSASAAEPPKAKPHLLIRPCEFQQQYQFSYAECSIELENPGSIPVRVTGAEAIREQDSVLDEGLVVPANGIAHLRTKVFTGNNEGYSRYYFRLHTDQVGGATRTAEVRGFVYSVVDEFKPTLDFGIVNLEEDRRELSLTLTSRETADFRITEVISKPAYLDVAVNAQGSAVKARLNDKVPLGQLPNDSIELSINDPNQGRLWVTVKGSMRGDVVPASDPYELGLMRTNSKNEALIRLSSRSGKPFRVGAISVDRIEARAESMECIPVAIDCKQIKLLIANDQRKGQVGGVVTVELPDTGQKLPIQVWGMLLSPEVEVIDMEDEVKKNSAGGSVSSPATPAVDIKGALKLAVREAAQAAPTGSGPLLKWTVAHDEVVFGYAIYRSKEKSGPFVRVNKELIPANGKDLVGTPYQWRDASADAKSTYWYYIGLIYRDGRKEALSQPQKILVKPDHD